jgi:hypothetical protein
MLSGNFFVFICCLIGAQTCYFKGNWKWFVVMVLCVLVSGTIIFVESYQVLVVSPDQELPLVIRNPTTPL